MVVWHQAATVHFFGHFRQLISHRGCRGVQSHLKKEIATESTEPTDPQPTRLRVSLHPTHLFANDRQGMGREKQTAGRGWVSVFSVDSVAIFLLDAVEYLTHRGMRSRNQTTPYNPSVPSVATSEAEWSKRRRLVSGALGLKTPHCLLHTAYFRELHPIPTREENGQSISVQEDRT